MLKNEPLVAQVLFDTAENEMSGIQNVIQNVGDVDELAMNKFSANIGPHRRVKRALPSCPCARG